MPLSWQSSPQKLVITRKKVFGLFWKSSIILENQQKQKVDVKGHCIWFFFHYITEKSPSPNSFYEVRSCPRSPIFCSYFAKHLIEANVGTKSTHSVSLSLHYTRDSFQWPAVPLESSEVPLHSASLHFVDFVQLTAIQNILLLKSPILWQNTSHSRGPLSDIFLLDFLKDLHFSSSI